MQYDVVALGELLIDFTPAGFSEQGNPILEANPGGAPCNVLAMLAKCGRRTGFIGKIGDDMHGRFLQQTIKAVGIEDSGLVISDEVHTTLAFVDIDELGERSFSFYRNPGADMMLTEDEVCVQMIRQAKIFHFGTLSMTHECVRKATQRAVRCAKESGCLISFDPNLRLPLWDDEEVAREQMIYGASVCDILKIEQDELLLMTQKDDVKLAVQYLQESYQIPLILVTAGAAGSEAFWGNESYKAKALLTEKTVDTTGAGDTYLGYCLNVLLDYSKEEWNRDMFEKMLTGAAVAASIVTTRKGALKAMPDIREIKGLLEHD